MLVNEIRRAEDSIQQIKERNVVADLPHITVLEQNTWNQYSHLFTKDLDQDEINLINNFYSYADKINYVIKSGNETELFL